METIVYMVRHAESPFSLENERERGLSEKGKLDAERVTKILEKENIDVVVSSPYTRAIQTVEGLAYRLGVEIEVYEDLRERLLAGLDYVIEEDEFMTSIEKVFTNPDFFLPGGESNNVARNRATAVLEEMMEKYRGKRIAIGTHGNIMTLMMSHFDPKYDLEFWKQTTKPDIYKMIFNNKQLVCVERLWRKM